ncbi:DNA (cytosine-5-)-methyltransferase [Aliifodinibius salipaludis]|uniref:DNA (cytosine-5-)-methyltransferase n=1 Tax=Fodinibius salipaludis TaxID=2032627 RepID=A0A2A2GCF0_9BACT|nr:DNA cytosine methyltransferase [Aliifodinibius salipaludis]PAU94563.1 DNA (cytosine-5-)-methyltransferase [Aliifodinibius salipaludis]
MSIPVIDVFAGPGGLGEGFSSLMDENGDPVFDITLSIEMDEKACQTLLLRTFFRQFKHENVPEEYYEFIRLSGYVDVYKLREMLEKNKNKEGIAKFDKADQIAKQAQLGKVDEKKLDSWIEKALEDKNGNKKESWLLVGGPPCQAYSVVGRSRRGGISEDDERVYLYREYYRILAKHNPPIFVMENVKGLLSAEVKESPMFEQILRDIKDPASAYSKLNGEEVDTIDCPGYHIYSFVREEREDQEELFETDGPNFKHTDFVIKSEKYGIPQSRHRVILLGIRKDFELKPTILDKQKKLTVSDVLQDIPEIRSSLSKKKDSTRNWSNEILRLKENIKLEKGSSKPDLFLRRDKYPSPSRKAIRPWLKRAYKLKVYFVLDSITNKEVLERMNTALEIIKTNPPEIKGAEYIHEKCDIGTDVKELREWYLDQRIAGICNHTARGHMSSDLHRYLFVSSFGEIEGRSPKLEDFPLELLPNHASASSGVSNSTFADRFRVQLWNDQAKTITSHISKDGHYYIHPDPDQCRSLTVREAARLQTFPDNYFFCGPRTSQYIQVGNAVPPLIAKKIAGIVNILFKKISNQTHIPK